MKKGIVFCHGKKHKPIDDYFLQMATWNYSDREASSDPDIVVDLLDPNARELLLSLLPEGEFYDYVLIYSCPIGHHLFGEFPKNLMLLANSILAQEGKFIFYNYFPFVIHYYIQTQKIVSKYIEGDITSLHGYSEKAKIEKLTNHDKDYLTKEHRTNETYLKLLRKEDLRGSGPLLQYCLDKARILAFETGYRSFEYLDDYYRPSNSTSDRIKSMKQHTLVFNIGSNQIHDILNRYITAQGYSFDKEGLIVKG